jgi:hypothetical protein
MRGVAEKFLIWCDAAGVAFIAAVRPVHVATLIRGRDARARRAERQATSRGDPPFVRLTGHRPGVPVNPAGSVRGPWHVATSGQTPVLNPAEARAVLDSTDVSTHAGPRDRAFVRPDRRCGRDDGRRRLYAEPPVTGAAAREGRQAVCYACSSQP